MAPQFTDRKLVAIGGRSGMDRQATAGVAPAGGNAVIVGRRPDWVEQTVAELSAADGAWGIAADLGDSAELQTRRGRRRIRSLGRRRTGA